MDQLKERMAIAARALRLLGAEPLREPEVSYEYLEAQAKRLLETEPLWLLSDTEVDRQLRDADIKTPQFLALVELFTLRLVQSNDSSVPAEGRAETIAFFDSLSEPARSRYLGDTGGTRKQGGRKVGDLGDGHGATDA
jgi:hypothetical protein